MKGIPINIPFIEAMDKMLKYAKFLQDLLDTCQQLEKMSKVVIDENFSVVVMEGIQTKIGDLGCLALSCEFRNATKKNLCFG